MCAHVDFHFLKHALAPFIHSIKKALAERNGTEYTVCVCVCAE